MIELTGLHATNPQAVMASFGLLRIATRAHPTATLSWGRDGATPKLGGLGWNDLLAVATQAIDGREEAPELNWADTIKHYPRDTYREQMRTLPPDLLVWLEAYWCEQRDRKGAVTLVPAKLDMTAGGQKLFAAVRAMLPALRQRLEPALTEALLGPWTNGDDVGSLGWDPGAKKSAASITGGRAPTSARNATVSGAMWLAFESLPLFPARWVGGAQDDVLWVLPHRPATYAALRQMQIAGPRMPPQELQAQGWMPWRARIERNGKFGALLPATPTFLKGRGFLQSDNFQGSET